MARPTDKTGLLTLSEQNYQTLIAMINALPIEVQEGTFPFDDRDKNIRDVLIHLYEWHQLFLNWLTLNKKGEQKSFLPPEYNWKTYPQMNIEFWQKHQQTPLSKAKQLLEESHHKVMKLIDEFTNEQLFTKKYFPYTGTTHLGSYAISATSSHYDWAIKKIKKYRKLLK
ncbi:ClbS/DfsB family four-helix bundle protein [Orbaceae bacterium ac157xtp]